MERLETRLEGPILLAPTVHGDHRGFFLETYRRDAYAELGIADEFVQDNHSLSRRGIVRGMHFQPGQSKLVRCARGSVLDVVVDIRRGSPTFGEWEAVELDAERHLQLYVPDGFAHGFCVLSDVADLTYKVSTYYDPAGGVRVPVRRSGGRHRVAGRRADAVRAGRERAAARGDRGLAAVQLRGLRLSASDQSPSSRKTPRASPCGSTLNSAAFSMLWYRRLPAWSVSVRLN